MKIKDFFNSIKQEEANSGHTIRVAVVGTEDFDDLIQDVITSLIFGSKIAKKCNPYAIRPRKIVLMGVDTYECITTKRGIMVGCYA